MTTNIFNKTTPLAKEASTSHLFAFTLAEVLITLGIIGVVAALSIPTLMNNINDAQFKTAYKKAFSAASQALISAGGQDLLVSPTGYGDNIHSENFTAFMSQFKVVKKCINTDNSQCWDSSGENFLVGPGYPVPYSPAFIDASGFAWSMYYPGLCLIFVDTNGFKKPNQWGKDRFVFVPQSANGDTATGTPVKFIPLADDNALKSACVCKSPNKCATENNYFGTKWLLD